MNAQLSAETMPAFSHQQILRVMSGIVLCILLAALDQTVVIPAVPAIAADLHGFGHLAWIVSAYLLTSTASTPIYGKLSDIYGRRKLLLPALVLFAIASALCAMAATLDQLILFRALLGLGGGGLLALAQAAVADVVAPRERGKYQGYMAAMWGIASIAGPIVGGYVTDHLTWRWIFWMNLPLSLAAMVLCDRGLRLLPVKNLQARIDYLGAALLTAAVTAWLLVLSWGGVSYAWTSPEVLGAAVAGVALVALLMAQERRAADPLLPPRVFGNAVFQRGVVVAFFTSLGLFAATFLLPLFFQLVRGANAAQSGLMIVPFLGFNVVGAYSSGQVARRLGKTKGILLFGLLTCCVGFVFMALMGPATPSWFAMFGMIVLGIGIGVVMPSILVIVQNAAERRDVGVATGSLLFLRSMGGAFGSTLVGALLASRFAAGQAALALPVHLDLGSIQAGSATLERLRPAARIAVQGVLSGAFQLCFLVCAVLMVVAVLVALRMADLPLRSGLQPEQLAH